jgi:hypothetical protein
MPRQYSSSLTTKILLHVATAPIYNFHYFSPLQAHVNISTYSAISAVDREIGCWLKDRGLIPYKSKNFLLACFEIDSRTHPNTHPVGTAAHFLKDKAAGD